MKLFSTQKYKNKQRYKQNQPQWDRFVFYIFYQMMRIRNNKNFSWWALSNAASEFHTKSGSNMAVFFGLSLSHATMIRKIQTLKPFDQVMIKTMETLKMSGNFGVAIFDNSQITRSLKYQRNKQSSTVTLVTSRCFVKPSIPDDINEIIFPDSKVFIQYVLQPIPSAFGMAEYENISNITADTFFNNTIKKNQPIQM
jgi:hypothetical protein